MQGYRWTSDSCILRPYDSPMPKVYMPTPSLKTFSFRGDILAPFLSDSESLLGDFFDIAKFSKIFILNQFLSTYFPKIAKKIMKTADVRPFPRSLCHRNLCTRSLLDGCETPVHWREQKLEMGWKNTSHNSSSFNDSKHSTRSRIRPNVFLPRFRFALWFNQKWVVAANF